MEADPAVVRQTIEEYDAAVIAGADIEEYPDVKKTSANRTIGNCKKDDKGNCLPDT